MANINISQILMKRGNTIAANTYVGPLGELLVDTGLKTIRVQDGVTPGGMAVLATLSGFNQLSANIANLQTAVSTITGLDTGFISNINTLLSNTVTQQTQINTIGANLSAFQTYANATFGTSNYGNANVASYLISNPQGSTYSNANVSSYLSTQTFYSNTNAEAYFGANIGSLWANAGVQSANIATLFSNAGVQADAIASLQANITAANLAIAAASGTYSNTNVAAYLSASTTGNVGAGNLTVINNFNSNIISANSFTYANGVSILAGIGGTYSNTNVSAYLSSQNITSANIGGLYNSITGANATISALQANVGSYYTWANANVAGLQSSITSLRTTANANTAAYLAANISTNIGTTGNVTGGNVLTAGQVSATGNIVTANSFVGNLVGTTVSATGNVTSTTVNANTIYLGGNLLTINNATTPVGFRATTPVTNVSVNNGSTVTMLFGTEEVDTNSAYNPATGRFTPNAAGYYSIDWFVVTNVNGAGEMIASLYKNGVLVAWGTNQTTATAHWNGIGGSAGMIYLNGTTDYISIALTNNSGSTATILAASGLSYFSAYLIR